MSLFAVRSSIAHAEMDDIVFVTPSSQMTARRAAQGDVVRITVKIRANRAVWRPFVDVVTKVDRAQSRSAISNRESPHPAWRSVGAMTFRACVLAGLNRVNGSAAPAIVARPSGAPHMPFGIRLRVWGERACFTRPEMKGERVSYEVIAPSAARGLLEAIHWKPAICWHVTRLRVLKPLVFETLRRNEIGSKTSSARAAKAMEEDSLVGL